MKNIYFISKNEKQLGPLTEEQILKKIKLKEISWMDYIFENSKRDWILIMEHPKFNRLFTESVLRGPSEDPLAKQKNMKTKTNEDHEKEGKAWYLLKENNNYGPFFITEIIQMLQSKVLSEYDFIWHEKFENWKRVAETPDFASENIQNLLKSGNPEIQEYFFRRRNIRVNYGCSLVVHDNKKIYKGRSIELSSGGAGIFVDTNDLKNGQNLFLHFQPGDGVPPFNAICSIVSKQFNSHQQGKNLEFKYGVRFTSISQNIKQKIQEFAEAEGKGKKKVS